MTSSSPKTAFWRGVRKGAPFFAVAFSFAVVFSVIAVEAGLTIAQTLGFSFLVIAGAAQFAAVQLMTEGAPAITVVAAALAVNLRMAMYSAALVPHLGSAPVWQRAILSYLNIDHAFAMSMAEYEAHPQTPVPEKVAYFVGLVTPVAPFWYLGAGVGAVAGSSMPDDLPLDVVVPVAFIAIVALMLRTAAHWLAAAVSVIVALALHGLPYGIGLLIAGGVAMVVGAMADAWLEKRA
ncbi:MAG: AzlC family ABC transporter permease [Pseudomonadota bacterium]